MNRKHRKLYDIYKKYQIKYRNPDSDQICCMWSTRQPPDILLGTKQMTEIEKAFDIELTEEDAVNLYDMNIEEAIIRITELQNSKKINLL